MTQKKWTKEQLKVLSQIRCLDTISAVLDTRLMHLQEAMKERKGSDRHARFMRKVYRSDQAETKQALKYTVSELARLQKLLDSQQVP